MSKHNKNKKPINEQMWVRILCGFLGILMALGTLFYVFATFELRAENENAVNDREIAVGIAYGNNLLPTYTVSCEGGFDVSVYFENVSTKAFVINSKSISVAMNNNLHRTDYGYEYDSDRVTVVGGYHVQISSYSFRIGSDGSGDNPVSIFPGGSGGSSIDDLGYTFDEVVAKTADLNESGILESWNSYAYPIYNNGKYFIRVGNFDTFEKAKEFNSWLSESLSMVSEISEPDDGSVSIIDYADNSIVISFFLSDKEHINVVPRDSDTFLDSNLNEYYGNIDYFLDNGRFSIVNNLLLEQYIKCVLPGTVSSTCDIELLKLFAVILRTKVVYNSEFHREHGFDVCTDEHCGTYFGKCFENSVASEAVLLTNGQIITHKGEAISPVFCVAAGATTSSCKDVFGTDVSYLKGTSNSDITIVEWTYSMSPGEILNTIINAGYTEIVSNIASISIEAYGEGSEYVSELTFNDILGNKLTVTGSDAIAKALGNKLPGTAFVVGKSGESVKRPIYKDGQLTIENLTLDGNYGSFVFVGRGEGNGLGLSIQGAIDDVVAGKGYTDIISKYYSDVEIVKLS